MSAQERESQFRCRQKYQKERGFDDMWTSAVTVWLPAFPGHPLLMISVLLYCSSIIISCRTIHQLCTCPVTIALRRCQLYSILSALVAGLLLATMDELICVKFDKQQRLRTLELWASVERRWRSCLHYIKCRQTQIRERNGVTIMHSLWTSFMNGLI